MKIRPDIKLQIIMSVFKSKSIDIVLLTCYSLIKKQPLQYISALIAPLLPLNKPILTTILTILSFIPNVIQVEPLSIVMMMAAIVVHGLFHGLPWKPTQQEKLQAPLSSKYMIFIYLFSFSFLSITDLRLSHHIYLILLFAKLIIYSVNAKPNVYINYVILISCFISTIWGSLTYTADNSEIKILQELKFWFTQQWWYYVLLSLSNWVGIILTYQIRFQHHTSFNQDKNTKSDIQMKSVSNENENEQNLHDQKVENLSEESNSGNKRNRLPSLPSQIVIEQNHKELMEKLLMPNDDMNLSKHRSMVASSNQERENKAKSKVNFKQKEIQQNLRPNTALEFRNQSDFVGVESKHQQDQDGPKQSQEQVINLFLLIPFTLFQPGFLHIPIYFYLIWLQNGTTPMWVFYSMFTSICALTIWQDTSTLKLQILLRLCLILIVNKNYNAAVSITRVLRSVWLRSSFVFVLLVLFWFSLLTVNLFHISFVLIVLLFITKNSNSKDQQPSFRHRNWKYLVLLFNIFLVSRLCWLILNTDFQLKITGKLNDILSIIGITYNYGLNWSYFNMIPLLVSGVLTVQYWTYSSRIYNLQSKKTLSFLPTYRALILNILEILTIIYYKLIPWSSHFFVIIIIISLEFSLIADTVLIISLLILMVHMIKPNDLSSYRLMEKMWNLFLKIVSIQIILRYIFEFIKFPLIFTHISQFPVIKTLIKYQQLLGLAIRQSTNSYLKNTFTKFQLMMILDFAIIAICFVTLQYYDIMIKYFESQSPREIQLQLIQKPNHEDIQQNILPRDNSQKLKNNDAKYIYENFIDFKITKWLASWNQFMLAFSKFYLKIYYPFIGTYSCLYYSYATFMYFLVCVYYYLKINLKFYEVYAQNEIQSRIMKLFHLWRRKNNIRVNLIENSPIITSNIIKQQKTQIQVGENGLTKPILEKEQINEDRLEPSTENPASLYISLKREITVTNANELFNNFIHLHTKIRFWIIILTACFIVLNYSSRTFVSGELQDFFQEATIEDIRYVLFMLGTSEESPISINIYLIIIGLTVIQIKCCSLISKIGRPGSIQEFQDNQREIKIRKLNKISNVQIEENSEIKQSMELKKFIDVSISLRLGTNKMVERFFVILLVFVSLLENQSPFSIIYLIWAWFLNYMGTRSMQALTLTLSFLVILQYSLIISDTTNKYLGVISIFPNRVHYSWLIQVLRTEDEKWISYLSFGRKVSEVFVLYLSLSILMLYQVCFYLQESNWVHVLDKMFEKITIGGIYLKLYQKISQIYEYALVYSPLFIITLCLGLYLMDFTATNMFLSILSIIFLFKSFLVESYTNSRPFWKSYFRILQFLIMIFMAVYCVLSTPMYNEYCNKFLCSPEEFRTKITKTILLLILQVGIDIISSHHFKNAMDTLQSTLNQTSSYYKIAISIVQNDKKINQHFKSAQKKQNIKKNIGRLREFLSSYQNDPTIKYEYNKQPEEESKSWLETLLKFMPTFIDASLIGSPESTKLFVKAQNMLFIKWLQQKNKYVLSQEQIKIINKKYDDEFADFKTHQQLAQNLNRIIEEQEKEKEEEKRKEDIRNIDMGFSRRELKREKKYTLNEYQLEQKRNNSTIKKEEKEKIEQKDDQISNQSSNGIRKSYIQGKLPFEEQQEKHSYNRLQTLSLNKQENQTQEIEKNKQKQEQEKKQKNKKILYLQIFESVVSNWHYLTYILMVLQFVINMGILTLPFPFITFVLGIVYSYQAPKNVWRLAFLALLPPIFFKYSLQIELVKPGQIMQFILIGSNNTSILIQFLLMFFIVVQCLILKIAGLYDECTAEVECMNIALIRNIINIEEKSKTKKQQRQTCFNLLEKSRQVSKTFFQYLFSIYECKTGYDYSTLMVTVQLVILFYIFAFYDRMAVRQELTFYKMIEYNQFTTGMVVMAFIQLGFMLLDRIMAVLELTYHKWDVTLIIKYIILIISMIYVHGMVLAFFPINANYFGPNNYIFIFYILNVFYFLISSLQVKGGLNKQSRGFLDRYSWYNGYIYMTYRAIPFLFEFKIFSDWTFTTTSLRLFDWIKYQQILGYVYVAKCNSLFLRGKKLGSKIQWWKKLLMGFPLLLTIILLLFGPLILFSSLNPLSSLNEITGGHLELSLKINKTNQYPFYINTHITDINFLTKEPDEQTQQIIKTYELDKQSIQIVHLEPFSDQYWEISEGSYNKLIEEPQGSLYQLTMRVKFDRNQTKTTPIYVLNTYIIPEERVTSFKNTLESRGSFKIQNFVPAFMRLDNNNGLHFLTDEYLSLQFRAEESRTLKKKYWVINDGITFRIASDKYSKAIFGYSVMSFYISIILVVANYFRFLFQGSAYTIIMSDIPYADPILSICDGIHQARLRKDIYEQQMLFWTLIDIIRSPDLMKAVTGNYLTARMQTLKQKNQDNGLKKNE